MSFAAATINLGAIAPTAVLAVAAMLVLMVGVFFNHRPTLSALTLVGLFCALVAALGQGARGQVVPDALLVGDDFATFFTVIVLVVAAITVLLSTQYVAHHTLTAGEYYALLLFCCSGMTLVVSSADLVMVLLGIEILSVALYVLSGFSAGETRGQEAAMKYFLLGAFSLAFLIYGTALTYGAVKSTHFGNMAAALGAGAQVSLLSNPLLLAGVGMILVGFAFKLSFAPFHMWTPDAYEGAPTPITAFMSVATKAAVFAGLLRFLTFAVPALRPEWTSVLWALAVLTMIVGNVAAVVQSSVKRMLAYSSIAQAGYILVGVVSGTIGQASVMFYLLAYAFMNVGAFAVLMALGEPGQSDPQIADLDGLTQRRPLLALAMTVFMLSLAGIPLTAGFIAKLYVFTAAVRGGFAELAVIGMLTSAVATFYYLRIIVAMYMRPPTAEVLPIRLTGLLSGVIVVLVVATIALGVFPAGPLGLATAAAASR